MKVTKLPNGITVASRETSNPYSRIGVFIKSGSRSEPYNMKGVTRVLANCAFLVIENGLQLFINFILFINLPIEYC